MVGWHHQFNGHEFEWTPGVGDGQGGLAYCSPWGSQRVGHNWVTKLNWTDALCLIQFYIPQLTCMIFCFCLITLVSPAALTITESQRTALKIPSPQESPNYFTLSIKFVPLTVAHYAKITCFVNYPITLQPPSKEVHYQVTTTGILSKLGREKVQTYEKQTQLNQVLLESLRVSQQ